MKKAIAVSCAVFSFCMALTSCGKKSNDSTAESNKETSKVTTKTTVTAVTTTTPTTTSDYKNVDTGNDGFIGDDDSDVTDDRSPVEKIPDAAETAISDAGDLVSDVIDELT